MKNLIKTGVFLYLIAINLACTKEEKNENTPTNKPLTMEEKVEGEWKMTEWTHQSNAVSGGQTVFTSSGLGSDFTGSLIFHSDETVSSNLAFDVTETTTYMGLFTDSTTTSHTKVMDDAHWSVTTDNHILLIDQQTGDTLDLEVLNLNETEAVLTSRVIRTETRQGITAEVTIQIDMKLEK